MNVSYLDKKASWVDNLDRNTLCSVMINSMLGQLNCPISELDIVLWCPPGKTLDDLVAIDFEIDCMFIPRDSVHSKVLVLFVNHVEK